MSLSEVCMAVARTVCVTLILIPFRLLQIRCFTLSVSNVSPLSQTSALMWGSDTCFCSHTHQGQIQSY